MRIVYIDSGGYRKELRELERRGLIWLTTYAYENSTRKVRDRAPGSNPTWDEGDSTWNDDGGSWDDEARVSDQWPNILELIGPNHIRDAKHLDSAHMAKCDAFLTSDQRDIASRSSQIFTLLGIRVFHSVKEWEEFVDYVENA